APPVRLPRGEGGVKIINDRPYLHASPPPFTGPPGVEFVEHRAVGPRRRCRSTPRLTTTYSASTTPITSSASRSRSSTPRHGAARRGRRSPARLAPEAHLVQGPVAADGADHADGDGVVVPGGVLVGVEDADHLLGVELADHLLGMGAVEELQIDDQVA